MNEQEKYDWMVYVSCMTFNQAPYIVDTMNGFTMQETNFPFICAIVDDASTDGEQDVIKNYLNDNFDLADIKIARHEETDDYVLTFAQHKTNLNCFFAVYNLKYNHYSIKKLKAPYIAQWRDNAKYIAMCEGDDYWISNDKLQKQVGILESHPDYTMACNRTLLYSVKRKKVIGESYCYNHSCEIDPEDVIKRTGNFISTCSIIYKKEIIDNKPNYWKQCKVGDYPLQIACALRGKTYYFHDKMSVYRIENSASWMGNQKWGTLDSRRMEAVNSQINMFKGFRGDYPEYQAALSSKIADEINRNIPYASSKTEVEQYLVFYDNDIKMYNLWQKVDLFFCKIRSPKFRLYYSRFFRKAYNSRNLFYYGKKQKICSILGFIKPNKHHNK